MAIYSLVNRSGIRTVDLTSIKWSVMSEEEWDYDCMSYDECIDNEMVSIHIDGTTLVEDIFEDINPIYPDGEDFIELHFVYSEEDKFHMFPLAEYIQYPSNDDDWLYNKVTLSDEEKTFFSQLLQDTIGDHHTPEMQEVMLRYHNAVDKELYLCINDTLHDREFLPVTVGYLSDEQCSLISESLGKNTEFAPRVVIDADSIRHILNRHGPNGEADHSMSSKEDIARLPYVLANFDKVTFDGMYSKRYKCKDGSPAPQITLSKRIDGTYYVITAVSDAKANKSYVVSAYIH